MLMQWMLLCEQWPVRMSWLLELVEQEISPDEDEMEAVRRTAAKIEEVESDRVTAKPKKGTRPDPFVWRPKVALHQMFTALVQPRLYDIENVQCVKPVRDKYAQLFLLDGDSKDFEKLLKEQADGQQLTVADVVSFQELDVGLKQFTMNLSPAVRETLKEITAHRGHGVDCDGGDGGEFSTFSRRESRFRSTLKVTGRDRTSFRVKRKKGREVFVTVTADIASSKLHKQLLAALGGIDKEQLLGWESNSQVADPLLRQGDELELKIDNTPLVPQENVTREGAACKVKWQKRKGSQVLRYEVKLISCDDDDKAKSREKIVSPNFQEVIIELGGMFQCEASVRAVDEEENGGWSVPVPVPHAEKVQGGVGSGSLLGGASQLVRSGIGIGIGKATKKVSIADQKQTTQAGEDHRGDGDEDKDKEQERKEAEADTIGMEEQAEQERKEAEEEQAEHEKNEADATAKKVELAAKKVELASDSKEGKDYIGTLKWAASLTRLLFCGKTDINLVIGLYAQWGVGKSFMMEKIILSIQCAWLEQRYKHWDDEKIPKDKAPLGVLLRRRIVALLEGSQDDYIECWWRSAVLADLNQGGYGYVDALMQRLGTDAVPSSTEANFIKDQLLETPNSTLDPEVEKAVEKRWHSVRKPKFHFLNEVVCSLLEIILVLPLYRWLSYLAQWGFTRNQTIAAVEAALRYQNGDVVVVPSLKVLKQRAKTLREEIKASEKNLNSTSSQLTEAMQARKEKNEHRRLQAERELASTKVEIERRSKLQRIKIDVALAKAESEAGDSASMGDTHEKEKEEEKRDIVFVWFNAWLYDDTDNMVSACMSFVYRVSQQPSTLSLLSCSGSVWYRSCMKQPRSILAANMPLPSGGRSFTGQCCRC
jgi:hypothetical protein